jgi:DNA-binding NarL/FixJ family response regulator
MNYTIAVVDRYLLIAKALTGIINHFKQYKVLYEAENGAALAEKFKLPGNIPDIVLLDITMPVMDDFETVQWLKCCHPKVLTLTLSMQDDDATLIKMIKCGAKGYLLKNIYPAELKKALDTLVSKGFYYPYWATTRLIMNIAEKENEKKQPKLNERETEFLQYACTELTYREIAEKMFCSHRTVESYRDGLFEKLGLKTRVGLVVFAIKNGIVKL